MQAAYRNLPARSEGELLTFNETRKRFYNMLIPGIQRNLTSSFAAAKHRKNAVFEVAVHVLKAELFQRL